MREVLPVCPVLHLRMIACSRSPSARARARQAREAGTKAGLSDFTAQALNRCTRDPQQASKRVLVKHQSCNVQEGRPLVLPVPYLNLGDGQVLEVLAWRGSLAFSLIQNVGQETGHGLLLQFHSRKTVPKAWPCSPLLLFFTSKSR